MGVICCDCETRESGEGTYAELGDGCVIEAGEGARVSNELREAPYPFVRGAPYCD